MIYNKKGLTDQFSQKSIKITIPIEIGLKVLLFDSTLKKDK